MKMSNKMVQMKCSFEKLSENLCKDSTDVVIAFFEVFDWALWLIVIPAVVNDNEA